MLNNLEKRNSYFESLLNPTNSIKIIFQVTGECNLRCSYCYETKQNIKINLLSAKKLIDKFFPISENLEWWNNYIKEDKKFFIFDFFGGECFLEVELMDQICDYFVKKCKENLKLYQIRLDNFKIICVSNGTLIRQEKVINFIKKWQKNIINMFISIDGCREFHDSCRVFKNTNLPTWELVKENIDFLRQNFPLLPLTTKGTIGPNTLHLLFKSYLEYKKLGFYNINITLRNDCDWDEKYIQVAEEQYSLIMKDLLKYPNEEYSFKSFKILDNNFLWSKTSCGVDGTIICLGADNLLYNCYNFSPISIPDRERYNIGTLENGINERQKIKNILISSNKNWLSEECTSCSQQRICNYCPAVAYKETGDLYDMKVKNCKILKIESKYATLYHFFRKKIYEKN